MVEVLLNRFLIRKHIIRGYAMRKLLLGTTALAAAATLTANAALADVSISGGAEFKYLSRSSNNSNLDGTSFSSDNTMTIKFNQKTDSGLDIDALKIVTEGVNNLKSKNNSFLIITHYQKLLDYIKPDFTHFKRKKVIT